MAITSLLQRAGLVGLCLCGATGGALGSSETTSPQQQPPRFVQDRFAVSFWVDPPADELMEQRYREIADAHFSLVLGGFGATTSTQIARQLDLCHKLGLKALVSVPGHDLANLVPDHPALWGYMWVDEPSAAAFGDLGVAASKIREKRPGKTVFINLFPNYAPPSALGTQTYEEHVRRFVDEVRPEVLCMDHYPLFRPGEPDGRDAYCANLAVMRDESLRADIPFWNFFNIMPYGPHTDPTEAQVRWQIYAALAYGAKGVLYFCYYTPLSPEFPKGGAILGRDGRLTRHYDQAKRINAELKSLGPTLMKLTSTRVTRIQPETAVSEALKDSALRSLGGAPEDPKPNYLVGEFRHADGRRAVLLHNYHFAYCAWPKVEFDAPREKVVEVCKKTGRETPVLDDSPDSEGLQISLDAGEGRLFLLPEK